jgi:uncharacterized SAM-binding protein YcdF (DUF218 family)
MKFLPYLTLILSFIIGYLSLTFVYVFAVAIVSAFLVFPKRRRQLRDQPQAPDRNMVLDGFFLVAQQTLIHFVVFALGIFAVRMMAG